MFRGSEAIRDHYLSANQLRTSAWVHTRHDVYADARLDHDHLLACQSALIRLPPGTPLAGPSAAFVHGVAHAAKPDDEVHVYGPNGRRLGHRQGIRQHSGQLDGPDVVATGDMVSTSAIRTAWDVGRWLRPVQAVAIIDAMLSTDLVCVRDLADYAGARFGQRGSRRAATAFRLSDGRAQSPRESELRVRLVLSGLPRPTAQFDIVLPNGLILHPDLAWEEFRVAAEYDGHWHATSDQLHRDRRRLNLLVSAGWIVLHVTSQRMRYDFDGIVREIRAALVSRGWRPGPRSR